jgi:two-component system, OmpR family, response regulator
MPLDLSGEKRVADLIRSLALGKIRSRGRRRAGPIRSLVAIASPALPPPATLPASAPTASLALAQRRILCTDRDPAGAESLARSFRTAGFDARGCADGALALREVTEFRPHACVLDLDTPGIGGCELAQWVRSEVGGLTFLIAVADRLGDNLDQIATDAGFDLLLARPADTELVIGLLGGR